MSIDFGPHPHGTKVPHLHAESMLLYAQDAMETDRPWERWECSHDGTGWYNQSDHPVWNLSVNYRRKPRTILNNGIEVPEPYYGDMEDDTYYYFIDFSSFAGYSRSYWDGDELDMNRKVNGTLHLVEENARKHAEALLSFTKI